MDQRHGRRSKNSLITIRDEGSGPERARPFFVWGLFGDEAEQSVTLQTAKLVARRRNHCEPHNVLVRSAQGVLALPTASAYRRLSPGDGQPIEKDRDEGSP
jgi:hypothetical protein